jgi:purine-binding chemotaxis protein CheW
MSSARHSGPANLRDREPEKRDQTVRQFVGFRLAEADYAIAITAIREIILMKPITRLPQVPDAIEGLINLRGSVIPIVNLRKRFGLPARPFDDDTRTIVLTIQDKTFGCIVDEVTQVMRIAAEQLQPVPIAMSAAATRSIAGLARLDDRLIIILDIDNLFGSDVAGFDAASVASSLSVTSPAQSSATGA